MSAKVVFALSMSAFAAAMTSPCLAQTRSYGGGVNWNGGHGGVSWDGGHNYGGGGYGGYAATIPPPAYRPPAPTQPLDKVSRRVSGGRPGYLIPAPAAPRVGGESSDHD